MITNVVIKLPTTTVEGNCEAWQAKPARLRLAKAPQGIFFSDRWALNTFLLKKTPCYVWVHACNTMRFSVYFHVLCYFTCCCDVTTI